MAQIKDILLTGFSRFDLDQIEELIRKHKLHNIWAEMPADGIDEKTIKLVVRHGLNLLIPVDCVELGHNSIEKILLRNPKFEELIAEIPRGKVSFKRMCKRPQQDESPGNSVIALARSYPNKVYNVRGDDDFCTYHNEIEVINEYQNQYTEEEHDVSNIEFVPSMNARFDVLNYGMLRTLGIIGAEKCIVLTK